MAEALDAEASRRLRGRYPGLAGRVYLNSNSTGLVPQGAERVLRDYWRVLASWRDETWESFFSVLQEYADDVARLLGAPPGSVVTDLNLSTLLGRVASSFDYPPSRNRVVVTDQEFPTVPALWQGFTRYGARLDVVAGKGADFDVEALVSAIDERTRLVCVTHGSYSTGAVLDLRPIVERAHAVGAHVAVDAYQTVGTVPLDVTRLGVDFLLGGAQKWLCGVSTAFLYIRPDLLPGLTPAATGWLAGESPLGFGNADAPAADARRFRAGTPLPLGVMLSTPGLAAVAELGVERVRAHSLACTDRIIERADRMGVEVVTPRAVPRRGGVVCLSFPADDEVSRSLTADGFVCSWRGALRIGPHFYNTLDEVDRFMDALEERL
ncbi:aminotransferase class V-fold PLP-dependent enzyme [Streptomyces sp. ODS05-4]|uniref:aminotransferase class V-fold PLP-dependent enzyme n=1 Tax=Streptomyces sp. ODS05-4 TaxID=2944939 RepID=UPI00210E0AAC|nr:aminotransferase class V-fold PLP-dependent enzyme [Streptomyces sp. ODS05-4]